ncbi:synapse-associated protein 1-like isoform X2 [Artemia franciscana]|uniref:BSD domain-containing protein n=1 Tax=Artemia franciscana TaxID=6661 RepID=A0AA88L336_ARTSF|nr:hypothetical protein QYM36_007285 [Artemia franciscana]
MDMFSGFSSQMSSWMGNNAKKPDGSPEAEVPQPENKEQPGSTVEAPGAEEVKDDKSADPSGFAVGMNLLSGVKTQVGSFSNWLPFGAKKIDESTELPASPHNSPVKEEEEKPESPDSQKNLLEDGNGEKTTAQAIRADFEEVSTKAFEGVKSIGSFFSTAVSKAGKTVTEASAKIKKTVEETSLLSEFNKEQDNFVKSKQKSTDASLPPWVGYPDEDNLKEQILSLSADRRNFVRNPPTGVQFQFDYETSFPIAQAILAEDENLSKMRFELVPKVVKEEEFWRNYFYRVSLIKQSSELSSANKDGTEKISRDSSLESEGPDPPSESNDLDENLKKLGIQGKPNDTEIEKEFQVELQDFELASSSDSAGKDDQEWEKEIEEMIGADDSDTVDLK